MDFLQVSCLNFTQALCDRRFFLNDFLFHFFELSFSFLVKWDSFLHFFFKYRKRFLFFCMSFVQKLTMNETFEFGCWYASIKVVIDNCVFEIFSEFGMMRFKLRDFGFQFVGSWSDLRKTKSHLWEGFLLVCWLNTELFEVFVERF